MGKMLSRLTWMPTGQGLSRRTAKGVEMLGDWVSSPVMLISAGLGWVLFSVFVLHSLGWPALGVVAVGMAMPSWQQAESSLQETAEVAIGASVVFAMLYLVHRCWVGVEVWTASRKRREGTSATKTREGGTVWEPHFALVPVRTNKGLAWLRLVERTPDGGLGASVQTFTRCWVYREMGP